MFSRSGGHKTKETYPTRPGSPTPCKQGLNAETSIMAVCHQAWHYWLITNNFFGCKGDVTRYDSQRRFLTQHSVVMLEQCCKYSKQCRNNVATLCCAKNRLCESYRVTSPVRLLPPLKGIQIQESGKLLILKLESWKFNPV